MALSNGFSAKQVVVEGEDRFTNINDAIIYHIFSFLGYNDVARIRLVSKRFNKLSIMSPYLFFKPYSRHTTHEQYNMKDENFRFFLRLLMVRRRRVTTLAPPIRAIRLHWFTLDNFSDYHNIMYALIKHASEGQVLRELDLTVMLDLPPQNLEAWRVLMTRCGLSLEVLRLDCLYANNNSFLSWLGSNNNIMSLRVLTLRSVALSFFSGFNLSISSSSLRVLEILDVYTSLQCNLCIACPSLLSLRMEDVRFSNNSVLNIHCPSLKQLALIGCHFFKSASISIRAQSLVRLVYESKRSSPTLLHRESFVVYTPNLQQVVVTPPPYLILNDSIMAQGVLKQLQVLLAFFIRVGNYGPLGSFLTTPALKFLTIKTREWTCHISDSELFQLFRSCPSSIKAEGHEFLSFLQQRANKSIKFLIIQK